MYQIFWDLMVSEISLFQLIPNKCLQAPYSIFLKSFQTLIYYFIEKHGIVAGTFLFYFITFSLTKSTLYLSLQINTKMDHIVVLLLKLQ